MSKLLRDPDGLPIKITTTSPLAKLQQVPAWNAPAVVRAPHSAGCGSAATSDCSIDRDEPCFITNASAYTHQQAYWINATRGKDGQKTDGTAVVEFFLRSQGIVEQWFSLDDACNLVNIDASLHIAMDKYAMFAITCSHTFLDKYIQIITSENNKWLSHSQAAKDGRYVRSLQYLDPAVRFAEYELVVLQPHHFLPDSSLLPFYTRQNGQVIGSKHYKIASDGVLCEHPGNDRDISPRFPPFHFFGNRQINGTTINPYLVILAAEIKFRRYLAANGPQLPPVYDSLMRKTIQVAKLLYFRLSYHPAAFYKPVNMFQTQVNFVNPEMDFQTDVDDEFGGSAVAVAAAAAGSGAKYDIDYWRHMLSGRDLELNSDDLDLLREIQESNKAASGHGQSLEKVKTWRETIE